MTTAEDAYWSTKSRKVRDENSLADQNVAVPLSPEDEYWLNRSREARSVFREGVPAKDLNSAFERSAAEVLLGKSIASLDAGIEATKARDFGRVLKEKVSAYVLRNPYLTGELTLSPQQLEKCFELAKNYHSAESQRLAAKLATYRANQTQYAIEVCLLSGESKLLKWLCDREL